MGIKKTEVKEETMKECVYCKIRFPLEIKYCNVCSRPIDINDALEMEKEAQEGTKAMMYELMRKEKADKAKRNHQGEKDKKVNKQIKQQAEEIQMLKNMITKMSKPE